MTTTAQDDPLILPADGAARAIVVLLHGLCMQPEALRPFAGTLGVPAVVCVPHGPVDEGAAGRSWWAVDPLRRQARLAAGPSDLHDRHPAGRAAARAALAAQLARLRERFPGLPLALVGFSQGGMLASDLLFMAEHGASRIDALALLSSTRIAFDEWQPRLSRAAGLPVLVAHGRDDDDLGVAAGLALRDAYLGAGAQVAWLPFDGGHALPMVVWRGLRRFLTAWIAAAPSRE